MEVLYFSFLFAFFFLLFLICSIENRPTNSIVVLKEHLLYFTNKYTRQILDVVSRFLNYFDFMCNNILYVQLAENLSHHKVCNIYIKQLSTILHVLLSTMCYKKYLKRLIYTTYNITVHARTDARRFI